MASYRVPKERIRIETIVSNSRFITTIDRITSAEEAKAFIREIRDEMPDASHHVYAFKAGHGASVIEGMSDDGEPSGTSGPPVLAVLRGSGIGDVAIVVTRYFGGTKLGTGGLVSAYSNAAKLAFQELQTEEKIDKTRVYMAVPYPLHPQVRQLLQNEKLDIIEETFGEQVEILLDVPDSALDRIGEQLRDLSAGKLEMVRVPVTGQDPAKAGLTPHDFGVCLEDKDG